MFVATLFIIANKNSPDVWQQKNKQVEYIHIVDYYSAQIKNKPVIHAMTQIHLKNIMLGKKSQALQSTDSMIQFV